MPELAVDEAAFGVHGICDSLPAGDLRRGEYAWDTRVASSLFVCSRVSKIGTGVGTMGM